MVTSVGLSSCLTPGPGEGARGMRAGPVGGLLAPPGTQGAWPRDTPRGLSVRGAYSSPCAAPCCPPRVAGPGAHVLLNEGKRASHVCCLLGSPAEKGAEEVTSPGEVWSVPSATGRWSQALRCPAPQECLCWPGSFCHQTRWWGSGPNGLVVPPQGLDTRG